jgi:hypothetical protein
LGTTKRTNRIKKNVLKMHPRIFSARWSVESADTKKYNCIAFAAGDVNIWWWPHVDSYWPVTITDNSVGAFEDAFRALGYEACISGDLEIGWEKVAIYQVQGASKHMARQLPSGRWASKLGRYVDIEHDAVDQLCGAGYGQVAGYLRRRLADAVTT